VTIVRNVLDNRVPRTTEGAVDEGIAIAEIGWIEEFGETRIAGGHIGRDENELVLRLFARPNFKTAVAKRRGEADVKRLDLRKRGSTSRDILEKSIEVSVLALRVDQDAFLVVQDPSPKPMGPGEVIDEGSKADSLYHPGDYNLRSLHRLSF